MEAVITVYSEYPLRAPRFELRLCADEVAHRNEFDEIQAELNAHYDELLLGDKSDVLLQFRTPLLSHQLRRLQTCLDVLFSESSGELVAAGRVHRGRTRRRRFVCDGSSMSHR